MQWCLQRGCGCREFVPHTSSLVVRLAARMETHSGDVCAAAPELQVKGA